MRVLISVLLVLLTVVPAGAQVQGWILADRTPVYTEGPGGVLKEADRLAPGTVLQVLGSAVTRTLGTQKVTVAPVQLTDGRKVSVPFDRFATGALAAVSAGRDLPLFTGPANADLSSSALGEGQVVVLDSFDPEAGFLPVTLYLGNGLVRGLWARPRDLDTREGVVEAISLLRLAQAQTDLAQGRRFLDLAEEVAGFTVARNLIEAQSRLWDAGPRVLRPLAEVKTAALDEVQILTEPSVTLGREVGRLARGAQVEVSGVTEDEDLVGGLRAPWYRLADPAGWVFGGFLAAAKARFVVAPAPAAWNEGAVAWTPVTGADRYRVEWKADQEETVVHTVKGLDDRITGLQGGAAYRVTVSALGPQGEDLGVSWIDRIVEGYRFTRADGGWEVRSGPVQTAGDLVVPASFRGKAVAAIAPGAFAGSRAQGLLVIPASVTVIGAQAFEGAQGLVGSLVLPPGLLALGPAAFKGCSGLKGPLNLPQTLVTLGASAFEGCSGFTGDLVLPEGLTRASTRAFSGCRGLAGSLVLPSSLRSIEVGAFSGLKVRGTLALPRGLTDLGGLAFEGCDQLTGPLVLPPGLTRIPARAFVNCSGLTGPLELPDALVTIEDEAFAWCTQLTGDVKLPPGTQVIGDHAFQADARLDGVLRLNPALRSIGRGAFSGCRNLGGHLEFPAGFRDLGAGAFEACASLTGDLKLPAALVEVPDGVFEGCRGLNGNLILPSRVEVVGYGAFAGCSGLAGPLNLPSSLRILQHRAFADCQGLGGDLVLPPLLSSLGARAFEGMVLKSVRVLGLRPPSFNASDPPWFPGGDTQFLVPLGALEDYRKSFEWRDYGPRLIGSS